MEELLNRIKAIADAADEHTRKSLVTALREMSISLEDADDTLERIAVAPLELDGAKMGTDLRVFQLLSSSDSPHHLDKLAKITGADPHLLGRVMRYLSSMKMIRQLGPDTFTANNVTRALSSPKGENLVEAHYQLITPVFYELPKFLKKTGYADPATSSRLAFHDAKNWDGGVFERINAFPEEGALFDKYMQFQQNNVTNWANIFSLVDGKASPDEVLFVDVGGGIGHQCARLRAHYPDLQGRVVVQDVERVIDAAVPIEGVEKMAHNIFDPQPIKGAKFYYLRTVLHDWPDHKCQEILQNIMAAMNSDSTILIDEYILPDTDAHWHATSADMLMLAALGAQERTLGLWQQLLRSVGLKIMDIKPHKYGVYSSIIVAVKAS
ncbi:hypothetical protein BBP40_005837 [Aspergillus hancockii]|nr:hypothetical protein BBP40_005837 [Aspergillus hancockii]